MSKLREFLLNGNTIEDLKENYQVKFRRHYKYDNLVLFTYDIGCSFNHPFQLECRGIILDQANDWNIVSRPYDKFFNLGESRAATIDWNTACVQEKLDGSMIQAYMYNGHWNIGTTGTPDANVPVGDFQYTFEQLFYQALEENKLALPELLEGYTLLFELCTEYNRIVVPYQGKKVYLIDCRDCRTGSYLGNDLHEYETFPKPKQFKLYNLDDLLASLETFKGIDSEGYVVKDANDRRIKVKHPDYVQLHHAVSGTNFKSLVQIALKGEVPETLSYFPHLTEMLTSIQNNIDSQVKDINKKYIEIKDLPTRKEYALSVVGSPHAPVLFRMKDKGISALEVLRDERIDNVINILNLKG